jgi:Ca-activated chloride channel family protein
MAGEVSLSVQLNKTYFPVTGGAQLAYVLIEAMPTAALANVQMPINFSLVLDHSGSMSGQKLTDLKAAAKLAVDHMTPQDVVSVVVFDDKVKVMVPAQPASDPAGLKRQIDAIKDGGGTAMSLGMREGLNELRKSLSQGRVSRMLLLTDGETFGDEDKCRALAADAAAAGIPIMALGLGEDWNMKLLDSIGQTSGGGSDFIPEGQPQIILNAFQRSVQAAQGAVVQNAEMVLRLIPGVSPRQVWRAVPLIDKLDHRALSDRDVQVSLGDLAKDEGQTVLVELMLPPRQPGSYRVAQAEVSYDVAASRLVGEKVKTDIVVAFTPDPALAAQSNPYVLNIVEKVTAHKLQTRALDEAALGNIVGATQKLRAAATRLLEMGEQDLAQAALQEADNLESQGQMSAGGTRKLRYETRKLTQKLDE